MLPSILPFMRTIALLFFPLCVSAHYAFIVDVGSTGSRAHLFEWELDGSTCGTWGSAAKIQVPGRSSKIRPGFATFVDHATRNSSKSRQDAIEAYMDLIRREMDSMVPSDMHGRTPAWILGTGGMRHFNEAEKEEVLGHMRNYVRSWDYLIAHDWIDVLDGQLEGVFSWVALNQLLGRRLAPHMKDQFIEGENISEVLDGPGGASVALVELGGASTQVVIEPPEEGLRLLPDVLDFSASLGRSVKSIPGAPGFVLVEVCDRSTVLYVKSFQGYGRQIALQRFLADSTSGVLPCLPGGVVFPDLRGEAALVAIENIGVIDDGRDGIRGKDDAAHEACQRAVRKMLFSPNNTTVTTPSMAQWEPMPFRIPRDIDIVGTENFYHLHKMLAESAPKSPFLSIASLRKRSEELCMLNDYEEIKSQINPKAEDEKAMTACFGLIFISEFMERTLKLKENREIMALRKVGNVEISWPLGHAIIELPRLIHAYPDLLPRGSEDSVVNAQDKGRASVSSKAVDEANRDGQTQFSAHPISAKVVELKDEL